VPTVGEVFAEHRQYFGSVPHAGNDFVCRHCLGPTGIGFAQCHGCHVLFNSSQVDPNTSTSAFVPDALRDCVIPMTSVLSPSTWYSFLWTYKAGQFDEYAGILAALTSTYLGQHWARITDVLGGDPDRMTYVPSKRGRAAFPRALSLVPGIRDWLKETLRVKAGAKWGRRAYTPGAFVPGTTSVSGRVILLDDAWVTGATAVSAAGALLREGADAVVILPLARVVDAGFWGEEHPYRAAMQGAYDPAVWPR
jgi:hypothetical protein